MLYTKDSAEDAYTPGRFRRASHVERKWWICRRTSWCCVVGQGCAHEDFPGTGTQVFPLLTLGSERRSLHEKFLCSCWIWLWWYHGHRTHRPTRAPDVAAPVPDADRSDTTGYYVAYICTYDREWYSVTYIWTSDYFCTYFGIKMEHIEKCFQGHHNNSPL